MSSSPSTPRSATYLISSKSFPTYRQVNYYDGQSVRIVESRRRRHVMRPEASANASRSCPPAANASRSCPPAANTSRSCPPAAKKNQVSFVAGSLITQVSDHRPPSPPVDRESVDHVPTRKLRRSKRKVAVVQGGLPAKIDTQPIVPHVQIADISTPPSTPPPTPKLARLPTPELDDLPDRPFCDCCIEAHAVKYCASCEHDMYRLKC